MSLLRKTVFGRSSKQNTFIGGVASNISSKELLSVALEINISRIANFEIRGNDIRCVIKGFYALKGSTYFGSNFKYYLDNSGLVNSLDFGFLSSIGSTSPSVRLYFNGMQGTFQNQLFGYYNTFILYAPNITNVRTQWTNNMNSNKLKTFVLSRCTEFGSTKGFDNVFNMSDLGKSTCKIYAPISEQTSNAGAPDGDLADIIAKGGTVIWVPNTDAPSIITDLSIGLKTSTTAQILFTNPVSTNTIQEFEVSIDEIPYQMITGSGQYITGLTSGTEYKNVTVRAIDIYYNRAEESNKVNFTTP